jgi:NADH-quinone oxidoreductase subunit A
LLAGYGTVALFLLVAVLFAVSTLLIPVSLRLIRIVKHKPSPAKYATFECGMETIGRSWVQFNFRYYSYAIMFVALDVMVVFIYPWAVGLRALGVGGLVAIMVFLFVILVGYLYAWKKKVMEWK